MQKMVGFRKLFAWVLIFGLCSVVTIKAVWLGSAVDIPPTVAGVIEWVTTALFAANVGDKGIAMLKGKTQEAPPVQS